MRAFANDEMASINGVDPVGGIPCAIFQLFLSILPGMATRHAQKSMLVLSQICPVSLVIQVFAPNSAIANLFDGRANPGRDNLVAIEPVPNLLRRDRLGDVVRKIFRNALGQSRLAAA
jgi:hypothetical protein